MFFRLLFLYLLYLTYKRFNCDSFSKWNIMSWFKLFRSMYSKETILYDIVCNVIMEIYTYNKKNLLLIAFVEGCFFVL